MPNPPKIGIALSGGGSRGDFEVGALLFLYDMVQHIRTKIDVICGTSVGSINAAKLAESQINSELELEDLWRTRVRSNSDMYHEEPWLQQLGPEVQRLISEIAITAGIGLAGILTGGLIQMVFAALGLGGSEDRARELAERLRTTAKALYNLDPIKSIINEFAPYWSPTGPGLRGKSIAIGQNQDGRLEVFVRGRDNGLFHKWQNSPNAIGSGGWSRWYSLPGWLTSDPVVTLNARNCLEVFGLGQGNILNRRSQNSPNADHDNCGLIGNHLVLMVEQHLGQYHAIVTFQLSSIQMMSR